MKCTPLFRCLPSDPGAKIVLAIPHGKSTGMRSRAFEHAMMGSAMQTWSDCKMLVAIYNRAVRDVHG
jgi:hypothetical protein